MLELCRWSIDRQLMNLFAGVKIAVKRSWGSKRHAWVCIWVCIRDPFTACLTHAKEMLYSVDCCCT
jgi:hypothetical protein